MKQKDIALIIVVVAISSVFAVLLSGVLLKSPQSSKTAEVVSPISADFGTPNTLDFNSNSVNPTQIISIGNSNNPNPF